MDMSVSFGEYAMSFNRRFCLFYSMVRFGINAVTGEHENELVLTAVADKKVLATIVVQNEGHKLHVLEAHSSFGRGPVQKEFALLQGMFITAAESVLGHGGGTRNVLGELFIRAVRWGANQGCTHLSDERTRPPESFFPLFQFAKSHRFLADDGAITNIPRELNLDRINEIAEHDSRARQLHQRRPKPHPPKAKIFKFPKPKDGKPPKKH
jgi:hypothetical protein